MAIITILVTLVIIMVAIASIVFIMMVIILHSLHSTSYVAHRLRDSAAVSSSKLHLSPFSAETHRPREFPSLHFTPDVKRKVATPDVGPGVVTASMF